MLLVLLRGRVILLLGTVVLSAGVAIGANTGRSVRRHGVPPDGGSLLADTPQVTAGISYISQRTNFDPDVEARCDGLSARLYPGCRAFGLRCATGNAEALRNCDAGRPLSRGRAALWFRRG